MKPCIMVVCGDPGGAVAVSPVIKQLQVEDRVSVDPIAYNEAATVWADCGIVHRTIPNN